MSYTLKIKWTRGEFGEPPEDDGQRTFGTIDETTLFIPAEQIRVHGFIPAGERAEQMKSWDENRAGYFNYLCVEDGKENGGRLISVHNEYETYYLATYAWLLGPNGDTIERIAP